MSVFVKFFRFSWYWILFCLGPDPYSFCLNPDLQYIKVRTGSGSVTNFFRSVSTWYGSAPLLCSILLTPVSLSTKVVGSFIVYEETPSAICLVCTPILTVIPATRHFFRAWNARQRNLIYIQRRLWIKKMIFLTSALCFSMKAPLSSRTLCWSSSTWHKKQTVNNTFDNILKTVRLYWAFFLQQTMFHKVRDNNLGPRSP